MGCDDEKFWYVKLGHDFNLTDLGGSAFSMDYAEAENFGANNHEGTFYSLTAAQQIAKLGTELYAILGLYDANIPRVQTENTATGRSGGRAKF